MASSDLTVAPSTKAMQDGLRLEADAASPSCLLGWRKTQIENLKLAIAAADRGEFASQSEIEATFKKYGA